MCHSSRCELLLQLTYLVLLRNIALIFICEHKPINVGIIGGGDSSDRGLFGELLVMQPDEQGEHYNITSFVYNIESFTIARCMWIGTIY